MPRPSTGCGSCRERHIKCDETRPECLRCLKSGSTCTGYRGTRGIIFKDVTLQVQLKQRLRAKIDAPAKWARSIPAPLPDNREAWSVSFFFAEYVQAPSLLRCKHFEFLVPLYGVATSSSPLALAVVYTAVNAARLHFGKSVDQAVVTEHRTRTIKSIRAAIANPDQQVRDETLLAVLCLDFAEHLASRAENTIATRAHIDGALALVRHRDPQSFNCPVSASLLAGVTGLALLSALWFNRDTTVQDAATSLPETEAAHQSPSARVIQLLIKTRTLESTMLETIPSSVLNITKVQCSTPASIAAVQELCLQMDEWIDSIPPRWKTLLHQPRVPSLILLAESSIDFPVVEIAYILAQWHCTQLMALRLMYAANAAAAPELYGSLLPFEIILNSVQATADSLCYLISILAQAPVDPSSSNTRVKRLERRLSAIVPPIGTASKQETIWRGGALDGKHCCLNILRWVSTTLIDEKDAVPGFGVSRCTIQYLLDVTQIVHNSFNR